MLSSSAIPFAKQSSFFFSRPERILETPKSLGALIRKHKAETKALKLALELLNKERSKMDKKKFKEERRKMTRDIRQRELQLKSKHEVEIEEFKKHEEEVKTAEMTIENQ